MNFTNFADPTLDQLIATSPAEPDPAKQDAIWKEANQIAIRR